MALVPRGDDLADRFRHHDRRLQRLEVRRAARATENFILDPVTVRALPPAPAPPRMQVTAVFARLGSGGPIDIDMNVRQADGTIITLHTFTALDGDGVLAYHQLDSALDLQHGDMFYPEITDGTGNDLTASFVTAA